jgi:hypothetical protein
MTARILRAASIGIALAGIADPACNVQSSERPMLALQVVDTPSLALPTDGGESGASAAPVVTRRELADRVRRTLSDRLATDFDVVDGPASTAEAVVVIGDAPPPDAEAWSTPRTSRSGKRAVVHAVNVASPLAPNLRIVRAIAPRRMTIWDSATVVATMEGRGLTGQDVTVRLFEGGAELASVKHRWRADADVFDARLVFLPSGIGTHRLEIRTSSDAPQRTEIDDRASLLIEADTVKRRVLVYQPRISWMAAFVARALERDPRTELSSRAYASRGIEVATAGLEAGLPALDPFDAVVIGAPDALSRPEVDSLTRYVTERGGSVILLADRSPSGPSLVLSPADAYDERLLQKPADLVPGLRASEMAIPVTLRTGWESLATDGKRPVVLMAPRGRGHVVFSGALDAWRHREGSRYWQDLVAAFAARTPPPIRLSVEPPVVAPGEIVEITAELSGMSAAGRARRSFSGGGPRPALPKERLVAHVAGIGAVSLWPGGEPDVFRGRVRAPGTPGLVKVTVGQDRSRAEATLAIDHAAAQPWTDVDAALSAFATAHGGHMAPARDLDPLVAVLRQAAVSRSTTRSIRPMRSPWWIAPFAALLGAEWTMRRRRHLH